LGGFEQWAFLGSREGNSYTDNLVRQYLNDSNSDFIEYPFAERGSDERQYSNPNINLPIVSIMRKKYHEFAEYHSNLDNLSLNIPEYYEQSLKALVDICNIIEVDQHIYVNVNTEPFLNTLFETNQLGGQNHLEPNLGRKLCDFLIYSDGRTFSQICRTIEVSMEQGMQLLKLSLQHSLIRTKRRKVPRLEQLQI
jgi:aminopeptidase-like protein